MTHAPALPTTHATPAAAPSRRAVLRGALWSVPAIQLAAAAPAFATSRDTEVLALSPAPSGRWSVVNGWNRRMTGSVTVENTGTQPTTLARVTITLPNAYVMDVFGGPRTVTVTDVTGATAGTVSYEGTGSARKGVFVLTLAAQLAPKTSATVTYRVNCNVRLLGDFLSPVTVAATAAQHTQAAGTFIPLPA